MLLQIKNFRFWMKAKMGQRGAALVEYAILLAFVAVIAVAFMGSADSSIAGSIQRITTKIASLLDSAASNAQSATPSTKPTPPAGE